MVATSKPTAFAEKILRHFGIRTLFDEVVGSHLDGSRSVKTEVIAHALGRYPGIHSVMIGDRAQDITGARNNTIDSIGVTYGYGSLAELIFKPIRRTWPIRSLKSGGF